MNRQPGKALPYFLQLRRVGALELIQEHNLFTNVQDQVVQLIDYEKDLAKREGKKPMPRDEVPTFSPSPKKHGSAIDLMVEHTHSIPVSLVLA